jgi:hypothetical protein
MATPNVNPFAAKKSISFCDTIVASGTTNYDAETDRLLIGFSVGNGKGVAKVEIPHDEMSEVFWSLNDWVDHEPNTFEMIRRTIEVVRHIEGEEPFAPYVQFKTSAKKNSRFVVVPCDEWENFIALIGTLKDSARDLVFDARTAYNKIQEEEAAKK